MHILYIPFCVAICKKIDCINYSVVFELFYIFTAEDPICSKNFLTLEELRQSSLVLKTNTVTAHSHTAIVLFPDLIFTCNGSISRVVIGASDVTLSMSSEASLSIQNWRIDNETNPSYARVGSTSLTQRNSLPTMYSNVYEFSLNPPLQVQQGDILGVHHMEGNGIAMDYQQATGPRNWHISDPLESILSTQSSSTNFDYPLIRVMYGKHLI